ncbi:uncharacterized protein lrrc53 isoform X2 [Oryzias melastigma]|uniref:Leucine rich repeat containing 53 n=1 Tax=Oryzias melastigma TaxID=30732 RepID=A0A3B3CBC1_ORYME|nr:uncharacterized protein lrrc53 isoform X2 [Oryzias melastigma]
MTRILLMLLLPVIRAPRVSSEPACPVSCVVCSEDAVICQRLAQIIVAPDSTQALLLTEGSISTVQPAALSELSNVTVLGLSNNQISELGKEAFKSLQLLHTLLLDHNLLTSHALQGGALTNLTQLKVLALGHNLISMIQAGWFRGTKALVSLKLEGNLLTSLDSSSFPQNDLRQLESLDLSDNLIDHLDQNSFQGLVGLRTLDLSRNRLSSAPAEAFSYLSWLTNLNLDLNSWNCTCELLELAAVLTAFIQQPDKTLYNGRRMVCVSADNPAVTTVLELTEANCVPSNQNITVKIETKAGVTPHEYARDMAITAVMCFIGGVALTLLGVLIYYQISKRKKRQERLEKEQERRNVANHVSHLDVTDRRRNFFLAANSRNKAAVAVDAWTDGHAKVRADENDGCLQFPNHRTALPGSNPGRRDYWMNGGIKKGDHQEMRRVKMEEEGRTSLQTRTSVREVPENLYARGQRNSSHLQIGSLNPQNSPDSGRKRIPNGEYFHKMYSPPEHNVRYGKPQSYYGDTSAHNSRERSGHYPTRSGGLRNVTFDLESLKTNQERNNLEEEDRPSSGKEEMKERTHRDPSSRPFKVKLNLNPVRKSKVQPRLEKSTPKSSKKKKRDEKERLEKPQKGKSAKRSKNGSEKKRKSSGEKAKNREKEENQGGDGETSAKQKEPTSTNDEEGQRSADPGQGDDTSQPAEQQAASAVAPTQSLHGFQYPATAQGGNARLPPKHPFSFISAGTNSTSNLSLLGTTAAPSIGSNVSLQGGNPLLKITTPGSNTLLPGSPANFLSPGIALGGLNVTPRAPGGTVPLVPSLQSNQVLAQALQANTAPVQSQLVPENSLIAALKPDSGQIRTILTEGALLQIPPESQGSKQRPADQNQEDVGGAAPQGVTTVENILPSNSQSETGCNPEDAPANMATGDVDLTEEVEGFVPSASSQVVSSSEAALLQQEYLSAEGGSSPRRRLRLVLPEKTSDRPPTALERKIR